jgi:hypothetical protein
MAEESEYLTLRDELFERFVSAAAVMPRLNFFGTSLLPEHNVVGIGVGPKVVEGQLTDVLAVRVYVMSKILKEALPENLLLPKEVAGISVDVIETGAPRLAQQGGSNRQRLRPFQPGSSIGFAAPNPAIRMAGTLGALVRDVNGMYLLSNNHVIAAEGQNTGRRSDIPARNLGRRPLSRRSGSVDGTLRAGIAAPAESRGRRCGAGGPAASVAFLPADGWSARFFRSGGSGTRNAGHENWPNLVLHRRDNRGRLLSRPVFFRCWTMHFHRSDCGNQHKRSIVRAGWRFGIACGR